MTDITNQKIGADSGDLGYAPSIVVYGGEVDIARAVADGFTAGDSIQLMTIPSGGIHIAFDAEITQALDIGGTPLTDFGYDSEADPDNLIDGQTNIAVGRFTTYTSLCTTTTVHTSDTKVYCSVSGAAVVSGKYKWSLAIIQPAIDSVGRAVKHSYTHE